MRLITFDVTNTLLHLKTLVGHEYLKIGQIYGVKARSEQCEKELTKAFKSVWKDMNQKYPNYGLNQGLASHQWWSLLVSNTFRSAQYSDEDISDRQLKMISSHLFKHYSSGNCWTIDPNSHHVLSNLKERDPDLIVGAISNSDERLENILYEVGLRHYFDFVIVSRIAKFEKPTKEIFDCALSEAKLHNGLDALHIGDDFNLDYIAATTNGWNALLLNHKNQLSHQQLLQINHNHIISDLKELINHQILGSK